MCHQEGLDRLRKDEWGHVPQGREGRGSPPAGRAGRGGEGRVHSKAYLEEQRSQVRNRAMGRGGELTVEPEWRATHTAAREEERRRWRDSVTDLTCARHSKHANQAGIQDTGEVRGTAWSPRGPGGEMIRTEQMPGATTGPQDPRRVENRQKNTPLCRISNTPPATWVGNMRNTG